MNVLEINNLTVEFQGDEGTVCAVEDVSMRVPRGRTVCLVGESGSGKTVISQAIMGLIPSAGTIRSGQILFNDPVSDAPIDIAKIGQESDVMRSLRGNRIAIVFQEPMTALSPLHTIGDQLGEVATTHRGKTREEARELTKEMLRLVQFPNPDRIDIYPFELSGGLRQRAMIAMALMCKPALLIADEPTTALDVTIQAEILRLIRDIQTELDMSMLMITHDFGVVANMADDVVVIYHGRIMESGTSEAIFRDPQHPYLKALLHAVPSFDMADDERLVPIRPIQPEAGRLLKESNKSSGRPIGETILKLENVTKRYDLRRSGGLGGGPASIRAMDRVDLTVKRGECLGLVGQSGSGKTTAAKVILGAEDATEGSVQFRLNESLRDIESFSKEDRLAFRRQAQFIFQDPFSSLNPRMTVNEILSEPFIIHKVGNRDENNERVRELMTLVGLNVRFLRRYPHSFSGGQRQRIGIARALALSPELLLCDEPVSALDVSVQAQILNLLKDLKSELGLTYVFVSHNLAVVDYIADRVAVMCAGRIVEIADRHAIINDARHPYTQALLSAIPQPDLDEKLDFGKLDQMGASNPAQWPEPYRIVDGARPDLIEVSPGHQVCMPGAGDNKNALAEAV